MALLISKLDLAAGQIGICPMPGRGGDYADDLEVVRAWGPTLVLSMTPKAEMAAHGAAGFGADLAQAGIGWAQLAVGDFTAPSADQAADWQAISASARAVLHGGGKVLAHCMAGCGRSGAAVLRLMVELGESPDAALTRLRAVRACAVERPEQFAWASEGLA